MDKMLREVNSNLSKTAVEDCCLSLRIDNRRGRPFCQGRT